ncbi:MAG: type II toxin-antitoxin system HicB family antitoxin [Flavobacteriales bacterium]|nr:type II toxin-antitoxin system HicB family antitoxin [Flavobacteriales bacterium]
MCFNKGFVAEQEYSPAQFFFSSGNGKCEGNSPEEAKKNILEAITHIVKSDDCPKELQKAYTLHFQYDTQSFLIYYSTVFSMPALERLTGINQKQLHHYCSGLKKPRADKKRKIQKALHQLGAELQALELV